MKTLIVNKYVRGAEIYDFNANKYIMDGIFRCTCCNYILKIVNGVEQIPSDKKFPFMISDNVKLIKIS